MTVPKRVVFVGDGAAHIQSQDQYREQAKLLARGLNRAATKDGKGVRFDASVVDTWEGAVEVLKPVGGGALVFVSNKFLATARILAPQLKKYRIQVYVLTGLPPDDEPLVIPKLWITGTNPLANFL